MYNDVRIRSNLHHHKNRQILLLLEYVLKGYSFMKNFEMTYYISLNLYNWIEENSVIVFSTQWPKLRVLKKYGYKS